MELAMNTNDRFRQNSLDRRVNYNLLADVAVNASKLTLAGLVRAMGGHKYVIPGD